MSRDCPTLWTLMFIVNQVIWLVMYTVGVHPKVNNMAPPVYEKQLAMP